ncbi:MAG: glycosyltransferase family 1 protein [Chitinophagaceae bacterium]
MKIVLIGNYKPDGQESMERFAQMLYAGFKRKGLACEIWRPHVYFGKLTSDTTKGYGKWLGYIDKWMLFPIAIRIRLLKKQYRQADIRFHIGDHSNAPYLAHLPKYKSGITCHDVLAIRGALGYADAYCPASAMGKVLQKWILRNLLKSKHIALVSGKTKMQLMELANNKKDNDQHWEIILNAFNADFYKTDKATTASLLGESGIDANTPYLLHVGSDLPRKNRKLLLEMVHQLNGSWKGKICYAGYPLEQELVSLADSLQLSDRIISVKQPSHQQLLALYSQCEAFVFPSFSEGFGWPVIEAQACGAPVIASNIEPMPEVSGGAAIHAAPANANEFAAGFLQLQNEAIREKLIEQGYENAKRFDPDVMIAAYCRLYKIA